MNCEGATVDKEMGTGVPEQKPAEWRVAASEAPNSRLNLT
jgi:hypothetical protein